MEKLNNQESQSSIETRNIFVQQFEEAVQGVDGRIIEEIKGAVVDGDFSKAKDLLKAVGGQIDRLETNYNEHWKDLG